MAQLVVSSVLRIEDTAPAGSWEYVVDLDTTVDPSKSFVLADGAGASYYQKDVLFTAELVSGGTQLKISRGDETNPPATDLYFSASIVEFSAGLTVHWLSGTGAGPHALGFTSAEGLRALLFRARYGSGTAAALRGTDGIIAAHIDSDTTFKAESSGAVGAWVAQVLEFDADAGASVQEGSISIVYADGVDTVASITAMDRSRTSLHYSIKTSSSQYNPDRMGGRVYFSADDELTFARSGDGTKTAWYYLIQWPLGMVSVQTGAVTITQGVMATSVGNMTSAQAIGFLGQYPVGWEGSTSTGGDEGQLYTRKVFDNGDRLSLDRHPAAPKSHTFPNTQWQVIDFAPAPQPTTIVEAIGTVGAREWVQFGQQVNDIVPVHNSTNVPGTNVGAGVTGPSSVIIAWGGGAYVPGWGLLMSGGGHDNGSNVGVFMACMADGGTMVVKPEEPYDTQRVVQTAGVDYTYWVTAIGMAGMHMYNGYFYHPGTDQLFVDGNACYTELVGGGRGPSYDTPDLFSIYLDSANNFAGIGEWTVRPGPGYGIRACDCAIGNTRYAFMFNAAVPDVNPYGKMCIWDCVEQEVVAYASPSGVLGGDTGEAACLWDEGRSCIWINSYGGGLVKVPLLADGSDFDGAPTQVRATSLCDNGQEGFAIRDGILYACLGDKTMVTYDPDDDIYAADTALVGPTNPGQVYGRMAYLPEHDAFVLYNDWGSKPWYYRPAGWAPPVESRGDVAAALPALSAAGAGACGVSGAVALDMPALLAGLSGQMVLSAITSAELASLGAAASGGTGNGAETAAELPAMAAGGAGSLTDTATATAELAPIRAASAGVQRVATAVTAALADMSAALLASQAGTIEGQARLAALTAGGSAVLVMRGSAAGLLGALRGAAAGLFGHGGEISADLPALRAQAEALNLFSGSAAVLLTALTAQATSGQGLAGSAGAVLAATRAEAQGHAVDAATAAAMLGELEADGTAAAVVTGELGATIAAIALSAGASLSITSWAQAHLAPVEALLAGHLVGGGITAALAALEAAGEGTVEALLEAHPRRRITIRTQDRTIIIK